MTGPTVRITSAKALPDCRLKLMFSDGLQGVVDLSDMVGEGVFERWSDPAEFARLSLVIDGRAVAWPGDIDICADSLHIKVASQHKAA